MNKFKFSILLVQITCTLSLLSANNLDSNLDNKKNNKIDKNTEEKIYLNFEDASLTNVVQYLSDKKKINIVPHKDLENQKVTLTTHTPFTLEKAWNVLLTILEINNFTIINVNNLYRIVRNGGEKLKQPLPSYIGNPEILPSSDIAVRFVYLFKNINGTQVLPVLNSMLTPGSVQYNNNINASIITEKSLNIKAAMKVVTELDSGGLRESIQIIRLKEASAENVAKMFNQDIFEGQGAKKNIPIFAQPAKTTTYFSPSTKIIADVRNNSLIMLGTKDNLSKINEFIAKYIDKPLITLKSRLHIKELRYTDAQKMKDILDEAIKLPESLASTKNKQYFEDVKLAAEISEQEITSEEVKGHKVGTMGAGNRLIVACTDSDWQNLETFIDKLDKPQPQVAMEILFVDVSLEDSKEFSTQIRNEAGRLGKHLDFQSQHINANPASFSTNLRSNMVNTVLNNNTQLTSRASFLTFGKDFDVHAVLKNMVKSDNTNIISQPYLVANNYKVCKLEVSEDRLVNGQISTNSVNNVLNKEHVDAKTEVEITPACNFDGVITLKIKITLNEFASTDRTNADKTNRAIDTLTRMMNGEVLVIGGLTRTKVSDSSRKTPILGDIPIFGGLFKGRVKTVTKSDLYVFIRPTIIKPKFEGRPGEYTRLKLDYSKLLLRRHENEMMTKDPIQRWFFNDKQGAIKDDIDHVDAYVSGQKIPTSVHVPIDPYYKTETSRTISRYKEKKDTIKTQSQKKEVRRPLKKSRNAKQRLT
ncbi:hypothetical protein KAW80_01545 [Candidatus Babeliales bacterium]|nr:hypothetical protein [Candidatus Babeliales bacterium]